MTAERGPDRRQQPRRHADAAVHYTRENVLGLLDQLVEAQGESPADPYMHVLFDAHRAFRAAERAAANRY